MSPNSKALAPLPWLTADLPGIGGVIKRFDEDFLVEELPLYHPCGEGTHVFFTIEKRGLPTLAAVEHVARALGKQPRDIGYAGMKDAHGVTRQMLSVEHIEPTRIESLTFTRIKILTISRHTNKLKLGHLAGNRFVIKIRHPIDNPLKRARAIVEILSARGVPNYFGPQRFGSRGDNAQIGRAVLSDDYDEAIALMLGRPGPVDRGPPKRARELFDAGDLEAAARAWPRGTFSQQMRVCRALFKSGDDAKVAWRAVDHTMRKLYLSAFQSKLFNDVMARRLATLDRLETGDIAWKHRNGACFLVEDAGVEQSRCDALEISPTGPIFGRRMTEATGTSGALEQAVLAESGISSREFGGKDCGRLDGGRRPLRVPLAEASLDEGDDDHGAFLRVRFSLPPGAYATNVIREITKGVDGL